ncbi:MAG TPA: matrixin family metalloprotease [Dongiaceae bacterium]|nr:matrixin family metalloprotease [Dongiaceae bacterium]
MRIREAIPIVLLLPIFGFIAYQVVDDRIESERQRAAEAMARAPIEDSDQPAAAAGEGDPSPVTESAGNSESATTIPAPARDIDDILKQVRESGRTTYLGEIIAERDSGLARWHDRVDNPLHIWVADGSALAGWNPKYPDRVREAFDIWALSGIPVKFTYVRDSVDADVLVQWVDHFDAPITGRTLWKRDRNWWIVDGSITIALHHTTGEALDEPAIRAIALHEAGHLLGLDHCADTANIMTPKVRVRDLTEADRATMRLLYFLPPGSLKH